MSSPVHRWIILGATALFLLAGPVHAASLDAEALGQQINIKLQDASMAGAAAAIAEIGDIEIAAPAEPADGISMSLRQQTIGKVLDFVAGATGMNWRIIDGIVVFERPAEDTEPQSPKDGQVLSPEQATAELLASLDPIQFFRLVQGFPLSYVELTPYQQDVLAGMLSPSVVGVTESGEVIRGLPAPEGSLISFITMPYVIVPNPGEKEPISLRLDSTPYIGLRKAAR